MSNQQLLIAEDAHKYDPMGGASSLTFWASNDNKYTKLDDFVVISGHEEDFDDLEVGPQCSLTKCFFGTLCLPFSLFSCFVLDPKEEAVLLDCGKFNGIIKEPGCHFVCCIGREIKKTSTKVMSIKLPASKTIDRNGNPLIVNGILSYQVRNAKRALLDIENFSTFVSTQSIAALKQVVARYPYEGEGLCLKTNADAIALELVNILQARVKIAGVAILTFTFNEISYATEIASAMLKKQQAQAVLSARSTIVRGAVDIVSGTVGALMESGIALDSEDKRKLASQLLIVLCSEHNANGV